MTTPRLQDPRLHAFDALRGFALLLGVAFHAALSFLPGVPAGLWAMQDRSPSALLGDAAFVSHVFRMSLFFFLAGFFARLLYHRLGPRRFFAHRARRILVPLVAGWIVLFPITAAVWSVGLRKAFAGAPPAAPEVPAVRGAFPLTHLWFLYQLLWLYLVVVALRALVVRWRAGQRLRAWLDSAVVGAIRWPIAVFALGAPVAAALASLPVWYYWQGIPSPDMSLIPQLPATVGYGTAFAFGWLVQRAPGALPALASRWLSHLALAVVATGWLLRVVHATPVAEPGATKVAFALTYGVAIWGWVLGLAGAALRFLPGHAAVRRYVADASYWIYLAHLPLVAALQVWVGDWPLHWSVKYPFVLVTSLGLLFLSYHLLVRPTFVGELLNGRRHRRRAPATTGPSAADGAVAPSSPASEWAVAALRGVSKRFGTTTALSGVDLELRRGELLAVLGPNGAGKTTAINLWLGLLEPDAGEVELLGGPPREIDRRRLLGAMLQGVEMCKELRVRELVGLAASYYPHPMGVDEVLALTGAGALADRLYGKLSTGQKRQAQLAVALCGRPRVLFLDEPTVGLDVQAREALWGCIRALLADGCSIVLTTHYLEEAEALASRVAVLAGGRLIACGSVDDMRALVARSRITCRTSLDAGAVADWAGVLAARRVGERLEVVASDAEGVVRRLLAADPALRRLEVREAGLGEAFRELIREAA